MDICVFSENKVLGSNDFIVNILINYHEGSQYFDPLYFDVLACSPVCYRFWSICWQMSLALVWFRCYFDIYFLLDTLFPHIHFNQLKNSRNDQDFILCKNVSSEMLYQNAAILYSLALPTCNCPESVIYDWPLNFVLISCKGFRTAKKSMIFSDDWWIKYKYQLANMQATNIMQCLMVGWCMSPSSVMPINDPSTPPHWSVSCFMLLALTMPLLLSLP